jgi:hypothetical protein
MIFEWSFQSNILPVWKHIHVECSVVNLLGQSVVLAGINLKCSKGCIFCHLSGRIFIIPCNQQECIEILKGPAASSSGHLTWCRGSQIPWNIGTLLSYYVVSHPQRQYSLYSPLSYELRVCDSNLLGRIFWPQREK